MNQYIKSLIDMIRPMVQIFGGNARGVVERWATIPAKDRQKLYVGMSAEDQAEADRLARVMADAISDFTVFVASRGAVEAD